MEEKKIYYNGENSDFEDDVVESDFEDQFDNGKDKDDKEPGVFGVYVPEEEPVYPDGLTEGDAIHPDEYKD